MITLHFDPLIHGHKVVVNISVKINKWNYRFCWEPYHND